MKKTTIINKLYKVLFVLVAIFTISCSKKEEVKTYDSTSIYSKVAPDKAFSLEHVTLKKSDFKQVPLDIGKLQKLKSIELDGVRIPDGPLFSLMPNLEYLRIDNYPDSLFPKDLLQCSTLKQLIVFNSSFDSTILNLDELWELQKLLLNSVKGVEYNMFNVP